MKIIYQRPQLNSLQQTWQKVGQISPIYIFYTFTYVQYRTGQYTVNYTVQNCTPDSPTTSLTIILHWRPEIALLFTGCIFSSKTQGALSVPNSKGLAEVYCM